MKKCALILLITLGCAVFIGCKTRDKESDKEGLPPGALAIVTQSLPNGTVGEPYSATLQASGGVSPYTWSLDVGQLPSGLSLSTSTGAITGNPDTEGAPTFTISVTDDASDSVSRQFSITVNPAGTGGDAPELNIAQWIQGGPYTLAGLQGKVVLLNFTRPST